MFCSIGCYFLFKMKPACPGPDFFFRAEPIRVFHSFAVKYQEQVIFIVYRAFQPNADSLKVERREEPDHEHGQRHRRAGEAE